MYFRNIYPTITKNDIESFTEKYINSEMEKEDLINFYKDYEGDMRGLLENIPLSTNEDIERYLQIYDNLFKEKVLIKTKKYTSTKNKIRKLLEDDPEEVAEERKKLDDLCSLIQAKKRNRMDFLNGLSKNFLYIFFMYLFYKNKIN